MSPDTFNKAPPFGIAPDWLGRGMVDELLKYARANETSFSESEVGHASNGGVDQTVRISKKLNQLGEFKGMFVEKMRGLLPTIFERVGVKPFSPSSFETELVAHGDGAFFARHLDTNTHNVNLDRHRAISTVYYFNAQPKGFSGGMLRLHSLAASGQPGTFVDIEPESDSLVFFPSFFPHEVLPVRCESSAFLDSRFAINCWINRDLGAASS